MAVPPSVPELPEFQRYQFAFTGRIRDPKANPRPAGVPARRMKVYEDLVFNNFKSFVYVCFPVCRQVLGERRFLRMVKRFFRDYRCHSPFFRQIPEAFVQWLHGEREREEGEPAFIPDLAHYEWVELAADTSPREAEWERIDRDGDLIEGAPALNPVFFLLAYSWPVHRISKRFRPTEPDPLPTCLLVIRDQDDEVRFIELNPVSARLLDILQSGPVSGRDALARIAAEMKHPDPAVVEAGGRGILEQLRRDGAVLGAWKTA